MNSENPVGMEKSDGEAPEKPAGEASDGEKQQGEAPGKPAGEAAENTDAGTTEGDKSSEQAPDVEKPAGEAPSEKPGDMMQGLTISNLAVGDKIEVTFDDSGNVSEIAVSGGQMQKPGEGMGGGGGSQSAPESYNAVTEYTEDTAASGETVESTESDENAVHVYSGANVTLSDMIISRNSTESTGGDTSSFYGVGAAILASDGTLYVSGSRITTDSAGGAGLFAYGSGTVYAADSVISTTQDTSGGIHAAGGGTLYAWNLDVTTQGESSAAIRSDRGGGTMVVDGGTYTSNGTGSPAVYSTADIAVSNADLTATASEAVCIEGRNSLRLFDSNLSGSMTDIEGNGLTWNVILYQSMSGDSEEGNSVFEMNGGTLTANNGGMFYTTNTESTFILNNVDIKYSEDEENYFFLRATGNSNARGWGTSGQNGADCSFTAIKQDMEGDIQWDSISKLDFYMTEGSVLTGAVINDESDAGDGGEGYSSLYISSDSKWIVTGDSRLTNLYSEGTIVDKDGNTVTIVGADGTVYVEGTSEYKVTVDTYELTVDFSGASESSDRTSYEVEKPAQLGTSD